MKSISQIMITLENYPNVPEDSTLLEAITTLEESQSRAPEDLPPYRAVLVTNSRGEITGKIGHWTFLKALEPKYNFVDDMSKLAKAGISAEFIETMMDQFSMWNYNMETITNRAASLRVKDIMRPVTESIDIESTLRDAIHKLIMWQTLSLLVSKDGEIIGILRLSDIYKEVADLIMSTSSNES